MILKAAKLAAYWNRVKKGCWCISLSCLSDKVGRIRGGSLVKRVCFLLRGSVRRSDDRSDRAYRAYRAYRTYRAYLDLSSTYPGLSRTLLEDEDSLKENTKNNNML